MQSNQPSQTAAQRMQCMEVLGGNGPTNQGFVMPGLDVWVWSRPRGCSQVDGGDVHFLSSCASGRITRMLLGDVCGQGPVFQDLAAELRNLMLRNINSISQDRFVCGMHDRLKDFSSRGGLATTLISTYFAPSRSFTVCNAGHPPPLIYEREPATWSELKRKPAPSSDEEAELPGVMDQAEYQQFATRLAKGDMVLAYSNVFTECRSENGQVLGTAGLRRMVSEIDPRQPAELVSKLVDRIGGRNDALLADNDATVFLCRATDRGVGWQDNLLAPFRLFNRVVDNTQLR